MRRASLAALALAGALASPPAAAGPFEDGLAAYDAGDFAAAFAVWLPLAEAGDDDAQNNVGWLYEQGRGVERDLDAALGWYRRAAAQDPRWAENVERIEALIAARAAPTPPPADAAPAAASDDDPLGAGLAAYDRGEHARAYALWRPLAEAGDADAQNNLGWLYEHGEGVERDLAKALRWYTAAAETDPRWGENRDRVAAALASRSAAKVDLGPAGERDAAARIDEDSLFARAMEHYEAGRFADAADLLERLARRGVARAQTNLGYLYEHGRGVARDERTAREWYVAAARQGEVHAQNNLAALLASGRGGPVDVVGAYVWFSIAASGGHPDAASNRDAIAGLLSDDERRLGAARAREFVARGATR